MLVKRMKQAVVAVIGRERANRITAPLYDWRARQQTRAFLERMEARDLCVNLGCGYRPTPGWVNVDIARGPDVQVVWDLSRGLPFPDASCSAVFSEHVIEHIPKEVAAKLLGECRRVLQEGGVLRVSTPDAERFLRSYAGDGEFLSHPGFDEPAETRLDRVNKMMREHGQHLWVYDEESLALTLRHAGFSRTVRQEFGRSLHPRMQGLDTESRAFESLYLEAVR